jgi:hypothetical protein
MWDKLKENTKRSGLALAGMLLILFAFYAVLPESKVTIKSQTKGPKTGDEIISGSYNKEYRQHNIQWDSTFKSAITPIKDKNGNQN